MKRMKRMKELIEIITTANKAYYQDNNEIMPDIKYDKLYDELVALEKETGIILSNSPSQKVGYEVKPFLEKIEHSTILLSLDKTKNISELEEFLDDYEGILSWKLDGLTIVLLYEKGQLIKAITRGNGIIGEDVTHNAIHFANVPRYISYKEKLIVRGEAVISYSNFDKINLELDDDKKYKNPRNLCSGTVRQLNSQILEDRTVDYFAFSVLASDSNILHLKSLELDFLKTQGFTIVDYIKVTKNNVSDAVNEFKEQVLTLDFPTDGLVLTFDDVEYSSKLGSTSKFPKDSIAFKWKDEIKTTTLLDIEWNTSRTGLINPIAMFTPIELEGTIVQKASLHNISIIEELELGIGDEIEVYKANMIIPQVADSLTKTNNTIIPSHCNACDAPTEIKIHLATKNLYCTNQNCIAKQIKAIGHYVSRNGMNIEGFSEATITKFIKKGFIKEYTDIYSLNNFVDEIEQMEGFGKKSYEKLNNAIEKSKNLTLSQFIYALGIVGVGQSTAKLLCAYFDNNIENIKNATIEEMEQIEGVGQITAQGVYKYFVDEKNLSLIDIALSFLNIVDQTEKTSELNMLTFAITGRLEKFENRKSLQEFIEQKGGKFVSAITSKTDYLINNDKSSNSTKNKKATELNVAIISEEDFLNKFILK